MMDLGITKEEQTALKQYLNEKYETINQMLVSNCEADLAIISEEKGNKKVELKYDKDSIRENLQCIKLIYSLIFKQFYKTNPSKRKFYRGTNIAEIERFKSEVYIDRMLSATEDEKEAKNFSNNWNRPAILNISLDNNVPYMYIKDVIKKYKNKDEILISPFTKLKFFEEEPENDETESKKIFNINIEKQQLDNLTEAQRKGLYSYIIDNAPSINKKLDECVKLENENSINYENIRKLEQLLSKYENSIEEKEIGKNYSDIDREADFDDIKRINKELEELKKISSNLFEMKKENISFINIWKRNIAVYLIAECRQIEDTFETEIEKQNSSTIEEKNEKDGEDEKVGRKVKVQETNEKEEVKNLTNESVLNEDFEKKLRDNEKRINNLLKEKEDTIVFKELNTSNDDTLLNRVKQEAEDNIEAGKKLIDDINYLISRQQNHARIAGNMGATYSALNNAFEMRTVAEKLLTLLQEINLKIEVLGEEPRTAEIDGKLERISMASIQISTLINYLNNPKIVAQNSGKLTRFDELCIIEENELKRRITEQIRNLCGEAELKKLKDDLEIIEDKGTFRKIIGLITGRNKLDEFMIEQIELRQMYIRKTLSKKLSLAYNYSIHEQMAKIKMFIDENYDDELVEDEVNDLRNLAEELKKNYVIVDSKVQNIIDEKEGRHMLLDKRMTKREIIETETYKFLNKYGYNNMFLSSNNDIEYQDTMSNEISRVIEYINSSNIL